MSVQVAITNDKENPLEKLSALLRDDMRAVNETIIARMQSDVALIPQLAGYLIASGGKRIRPLLTLTCTSLFAGDMTRAHKLSASVEFIHTATLLHDDVVDGSDERRGKQAANLVFGNQASVLVGDFLFSRAFQLMVEDGSLETLRILSDASAIIAQGEVMQLSMTNDLNITMDDYFKIISAKTAALFAAACEIGPVIAGADKKVQQAMYDFGLNLGLAFQIIDDLLDYNADQKKLGKAIGDDFREGKLTAPVILALQNASDNERAFWQRTMAGKQQKDGDLETAMEILSSHNALEKSTEIAHKFVEKAISSLGAIKDCELKQTLEEIVNFTIEREY